MPSELKIPPHIRIPGLRMADRITDLVGHTPMLRLHNLSPAGGAQIFTKLEFLNPGGSIKDRAALGMIEDAERRGVLKPGGTVIEATAGNTGVGLALIGVSRGYNVVLFVPEGFSEEKCILMRALGATVIRTPHEEMMSGAIRRALELAKATPGSFTALQFENPSNPDYHYQTTAVEIAQQMEDRIDAMVIGVGSAGTFTGVARYLKERNPDVLTVAVETEGSVLQGGVAGHHRVEGIGVSFVPATFDRSVCDRIMRVMDDDAFAMVKRLAAEEGLLAGSSAGANVHAAIEIARTLGPEQRVVTIIPDSAERYMSKNIFEGGIESE